MDAVTDPHPSPHNRRNHLLAWLVIPFFAVANGTLRELTYGRFLPTSAAHNLSVIPLLLAIVAFTAVLARRWPLSDQRAGAEVGVVWLLLTMTFEFGLGAATGVPMRTLIAQYDIFHGQLWPFIPLTMAIAPEAMRRLHVASQGQVTP